MQSNFDFKKADTDDRLPKWEEEEQQKKTIYFFLFLYKSITKTGNNNFETLTKLLQNNKKQIGKTLIFVTTIF